MIATSVYNIIYYDKIGMLSIVLDKDNLLSIVANICYIWHIAGQ